MTEILGLKIKEARKQKRITQRELSARIGVSPTYMNLIENGKRPVAGKILNDICSELDVELSYFSEQEETGRLSKLLGVSFVDGVDENSARRFLVEQPDWVEVLFACELEIQNLRERLRVVSDRVAQDVVLSQNLHDLLSSATSIRSSASILNTQGDLSAEIGAQFRQILHSEARELSDKLRELVGYLDQEAKSQANDAEIQNRLTRFVSEHHYLFPSLEELAKEDVSESALRNWISSEIDDGFKDEPRALNLFRLFLYDISMIDAKAFLETAAKSAWDFAKISYVLNQPIDRVLRRFAMLSVQAGFAPVNMQIIDQTGFAWLRTPIIDRAGSAELSCLNWPIFNTHNPGELQSAQVEISKEQRAISFAASGHFLRPDGQTALRLSTMISVSSSDQHPWQDQIFPQIAAGVNCIDCAIKHCANRRNRALLQENNNHK